MEKLTVDSFVNQIDEAVNKLTNFLEQPPIIYTYRSFWRRIGDPDFTQCPLWVVDLKDDGTPRLPKPWTEYHIHQYSHTGSVSGVSGDVDLNRLNGNGLSTIVF